MMARIVDPRDRAPKDPGRLARAELVRAATAEDWAARGKGGLHKAGRDGLRLAVAKAPEFIYDADGEVVGVDAWVQLFDEQGRELKIDPHRRIINPPTVPRSGVRLVDTGRVEHGQPVMERRLTTDPTAAFWEAVWDSVEEAPNPKGWRTRGTVTTVYADTADGSVFSSTFSGNYAGARAGTGDGGLGTTNSDILLVGQGTVFSGYECDESFVSFDTSSIPDADTISQADLALYLTTDDSATDFTIEARTRDWGASLTTADWVPGASLGSFTLLASLSTSGIGATGAYKTLNSEAALLSAPNMKTGVVYVMLNSSRHRVGNTPTGNEGVRFASANAAGTTQDPRLTITHQGLGSAPFFTHRPNRIWRLG